MLHERKLLLAGIWSLYMYADYWKYKDTRCGSYKVYVGYREKGTNQRGGPCGSHPHFSIKAAACSAVYPINTGPVKTICGLSSF